MIKNTFELFREPFDRANINRDHALERDSSLAAVTARVQYLAQIIVSVVSVPFLLLTGLYDLLKGDCKPLNIPIAILTQLLIILPISILGAILPMSWSRSIDISLSNCTRNRAISNHTNDCLPYLEQRLNVLAAADARGQPTIEIEDLEAAIAKKKTDLKTEALKLSLDQIKADLLAAPQSSIQQADLYEMLKKKEEHLTAESRKTVDRLTGAFLATCDESIDTIEKLQNALRDCDFDTTTMAYTDFIETLARKKAQGPEPVEALIERFPLLAGNPVDEAVISSAIVKKYMETRTLEQLRELHQAAQSNELEVAIEEKTTVIARLATCETFESLSRPPQAARNNPALVELYVEASNQKFDYVAALAAQKSFEELRADLANARNPVKESDLTEAIVQKFVINNSYYELKRLRDQARAPVDPILLAALERRNHYINNIVSDSTIANLEQSLIQTAPVEPAPATINHKDLMEAVRRKYLLDKTMEQLEHMVAPDAPERPPVIQAAANDVIREKRVKIRQLVDSNTLAALVRLHNAERNAVKKEILAAAHDKKLEKIEHLCETISFVELNNRHQRAADNTMQKSDLLEAFEKKRARLTDLVQNNTTQQLEELHGAFLDDHPVQKEDLAYVVREKARQIAAAEAAAAQAANPPAPAPVLAEAP